MSKTAINFAIQGFGHIGKKHLDAIRKISNANCVAIIETNPNISSEIPTYASLSEAISDKKIEIVTIATPNFLHLENANAAINQNCNVVIEKPVALNSKKILSFITSLEKTSKKAYPIFQLRYSPEVVFLKHLVENKLCGDIYQVDVNCYWNRADAYYNNSNWKGKKELDGGVLYTQFSHFIDLLFYLFGEQQISYAEFYQHRNIKITEFEDTGFVKFNAENFNYNGYLHYTTTVFKKNLFSSIRILGSHGAVELSGQYMNEITFLETDKFGFEFFQKFKETLNPINGHQRVFEEIIKDCTGETNQSFSIKEAIGAIKFIEQAYSFK